MYHYFIIKNLLKLAEFNRALKRTTDAAETTAVCLAKLCVLYP